MARILLIDDEDNIRLITRKMLERDGHEVLEAESGEEGLKVLEDTRPDVILLDVMMPRMKGWEVCERIKADQNIKDIPVIMFTVLAEEQHIERTKEVGADGHIKKPFDRAELLRVVREAIG